VNLHALANKAISRINPNEPCLVCKSLGQDNVKGRIVSKYAPGVPAELQLQTESPDELARMSENVGVIEQTRKAWINVEPGLEPLSRPKATGGDMVRRVNDWTWWLVTATLDDFAGAGWTCVRLTLQVDPPNIVEPDPES
jgi:hypothetical protein